MNEPSEKPVRILSTAAAAALLDLRPGTLARLRQQGAGPPFQRHGGRICYCRPELAEWSKTRRRTFIVGGHAAPLHLLAGMAALLGVLLALHLWKRPLLIWNASPSVSTGLYRVAQAPPRFGDVAVVRLPDPIARLAERRGYLAARAYLLKPVAGIAGDRVCRFGIYIFVRHRFAALALAKDRHARMMPAWQGCRTLGTGELFLLAHHPNSFDSRYFGPIAIGQVGGIAVLVWPARTT